MCAPDLASLFGAAAKLTHLERVVQKYDVPRPSYDRWFSLGMRNMIPRHGISFILAKRYATMPPSL